MHRLLIGLLALVLAPAVAALTEPELLPADQAFAISANSDGPDQLSITWRIADGYYLYKSKFRVSTDTPGISLGAADLPPSLTQQDPIFGEVQIYRDRVTLTIPVDRAAGAPDTVSIKTRSQGCADIGVCYPPHAQQVLVALSPDADAPPPVAGAAIAEMQQVIDNRIGSQVDTGALPAAGGDPLAELAALGNSIGNDLGDDGILPVEQAYRFLATVESPDRIRLQWQIADGTYLYSDKMQVFLRGDGVGLGQIEWPKPKLKSDTVRPDGTIGDVSVYLQEVDVVAPLKRTGRGATEAELTVRYQGCADRGICYPPVKQVVKLAIPASDAAALPPTTLPAAAAGGPSGGAPAELASLTPPEAPSASPSAPPPAGLSEQDRISAMISGSNLPAMIGVFLLIGIGLAFTPCIFPMVPILSGIITGQGTNISTHKAFVLSLTYVLSMAVVYALLGILVGALGAEFNLQAQSQSPWILVPIAILFAVLALSMFGFYELQLPASWQTHLNHLSTRQESGTLIGVAVMGALSALVVGPCTGPAIAGVMLYIWSTGEIARGGLALLMMGIGIGLPLLAFGTSAGKLLPKAGKWMNAVKATFGVLMLAIAILLIERLSPTYVPESVPMLMWGALLIVSAIYMGALQQLKVEASGWSKLWKGVGLVMLVYGATFVIGVAAGGHDLLQPLRGVLVSGEARQQHLRFQPIKTSQDLERALVSARDAQRPVMLDFYADWCVYCKQMERETFSDPDVQLALADHVLLQADVTLNDDADRALQQGLAVPAPPAILFWGADGVERRAHRLLGFMGPAEFAAHVRAASR